MNPWRRVAVLDGLRLAGVVRSAEDPTETAEWEAGKL